MKPFKIVIASVVQEQIRDQVFYIARHSIDNALDWEDRLRVAIEGIGMMPGHAVDEEASHRLGLRIHKCVFEKIYLIHYQGNDATGTVNILNFRHGTRLPRKGEP